MKSLFHKLLIVCCALYLSGAHWMVLQVTAWTGMLVERSQRASVAEAVETTFDGLHPCSLCMAVREGQKQEEQQNPVAPSLKQLLEIKLIAMESVELPLQRVDGMAQWPDFVRSFQGRADAPPTPPPLLA